LITGQQMTVPDDAGVRDRELWDDEIWEEILPNIDRVIPIIGPGCYTVSVHGRQLRMDAYVAEQLAAQLNASAELGPSPTLNQVVSWYLRRSGRRQSLYPRIQGIVQAANFDPPNVLRQLAEIRDFNLFVTTAFDPLLEIAINTVRFAGERRVEALSYAPNNVFDLKASKTALARPVVYHLFGRAAANPYSYAICDEDLLEWLHALQSSEQQPRNLCDELEGNYLLILGSDLSGWAPRVFLRSTKQKRLSDQRNVVEILADDRSSKDVELITFLAAFSSSTRIFPYGDAEAFVELLLHRWRERYGKPEGQGTVFVPPPAEMPEGAIFISYAREDLEAVQNLRSDLEAAGLTVWFDLDRLGLGDSFEHKIHECIRRCSLFMPVLSEHTETRDEGFFRREWRFALDRDLDIDPRKPFIVPVAINNRPKIELWPPRFREIHYRRAPSGRADPDLITDLKRLFVRQ
jgi:TIR domain/SIR2-like domain